LSTEFREISTVAVALRNQALADMLHDAIRGDVYAAYLYATTSPARRTFVIGEFHTHAQTLRQTLKNTAELKLPNNVKASLKDLTPRFEVYVASAERAIKAAFDTDPLAAKLLDDFALKFSELATLQDQIGDTLENYAKAKTHTTADFASRAASITNFGLVLGILIGGFALWVTHVDVLLPMQQLSTALAHLRAGDYEVPLPVRRTDEIGAMARTIEAFGKDAQERTRLSHETRILSELNEWLQSAKSEPELYQMIAEFLSTFLPQTMGAIYVYANSRDVLECVKIWNRAQSSPTMHPDDCWGLRRGRTYTHGQHEIEFDCSHVQAGAGNDYCCIPILAHGETVGLLHLEYDERCCSDALQRQRFFAEQRRLGLAAVEHISMAIANVKLRDQLRDQSIHDVLTGLFNRRYMLEASRRQFQRAARSGQPVALLSIDVDHFKKFNDHYGHDAGDAVLRAVGEVMLNTFRGDDVPCRFGGEEFVALLPGAPLQVAVQRAEELRAKIEALTVRYADGNLPRITVSVGVASYPDFGNAPMEVLKAADGALYDAKRNGRNRIEVPPRNSAAPIAQQRPGPELNQAILDRLNEGADPTAASHSNTEVPGKDKATPLPEARSA
jgi:diguanylate cyclase (GGDEF)-like protein